MINTAVNDLIKCFRLKTFRIYTRKLMLLLYFLIYGVFSYGPSLLNYSSVSTTDFIQRAVYEAFLVICLIAICTSRTIKNHCIYVTYRDLSAPLIILLALAIIKKDLLVLSLTGDEVAYSQTFISLITTMLGNFPSIFPNSQYKYFVNLSQILILGIVYFTQRIVFGYLKRYELLIVLSLFTTLRVISVVTINGQYQYLSGFALTNSSLSFFWLSNISVRLGSAFFFVFFAWKLFDKITGKNEISTANKALFMLAVLNIPFFSNSIFTIDTTGYFIFIGGFLLRKLMYSTDKDWFDILLLISLGSTLRVTLLIFFIITILIMISEGSIFKFKEFLPVLLVIPYVQNLFYLKILETFSDRKPELTSLQKYEVFLISIKHLLKFPLIVMLVFVLTILICKSPKILALYVFTVSVFYIPMIPNTVGFPKYPLEVLGPIILVGFSMLLRQILNLIRRLISGFVFTCALIVLLSGQLFGNTINYEVKMSSSSDYEILPITFISYPNKLSDSFAYIRKFRLTEKCYNPGITYGVFNQLLEGYTFQEFTNAYKLHQENSLKSSSTLDVVSRNNCLQLSTNLDILRYSQILKQAKWVRVYNSLDPIFKTKVEIWTKIV